jgi:hypothetical protein
MVFERQPASSVPFENTKDGHVKDLKDLSCVWRKNYDSNPYLGEKTDHISGDMTRTLLHQ